MTKDLTARTHTNDYIFKWTSPAEGSVQKKSKHKHTMSLETGAILKQLDTFGTDKHLKVHRFTNNLQGLQKVMVNDFS